MWQATSIVPAGSAGAFRGSFVQFQTPFLSSGMNILPKAQRSCGTKPFTTQHQWVRSEQISPLTLYTLKMQLASQGSTEIEPC